MRSFVLVLLAGCNQIYGLDPTALVDAAPDANPAVDEDLDGVLNDVDNCPGVPNPGQENLIDFADAIGDACDPDVGRNNRIVAQYFFNTAADHDRFMPDGAFEAGDGFFTIKSSTTVSYLHNLDTLVVGSTQLAVEAGFELEDPQVGLIVGVYTDARTNHGWFERLPAPMPDHLYLSDHYPVDSLTCEDATPRNCNRTAVGGLPARVVLQLRRDPMHQNAPLLVRLAGVGVNEDYVPSGTIDNTFGIFVRSANARLLYVIVYAGQ